MDGCATPLWSLCRSGARSSALCASKLDTNASGGRVHVRARLTNGQRRCVLHRETNPGDDATSTRSARKSVRATFKALTLARGPDILDGKVHGRTVLDVS